MVRSMIVSSWASRWMIVIHDLLFFGFLFHSYHAQPCILTHLFLAYFFWECMVAFSALRQVARIVCKIIIMELFLILAFAAMACHLYFDYDPFHNLPSSFLSLFESTWFFW